MANAHHDVEAENIKYAAPGVDAGLKALEGSGDPSRDYFQGAAVFLHTDGTGKDHFAQHVHRLAVVQSLLAAGSVEFNPSSAY
jgi:hypothetical protein